MQTSTYCLLKRFEVFLFANDDSDFSLKICTYFPSIFSPCWRISMNCRAMRLTLLTLFQSHINKLLTKSKCKSSSYLFLFFSKTFHFYTVSKFKCVPEMGFKFKYLILLHFLEYSIIFVQKNCV